MICIESHEQTETRIDAMLREMVVEEGLAAFEAGRDPKSYTLKEIGEFKFTPFNESIKNLIQFYKENLTAKDIEAFRKKAS